MRTTLYSSGVGSKKWKNSRINSIVVGYNVRARNQSRHISRNGRNNMGDCAMKIAPAILNFGKPPSCIDLVSMRFEEATAGMIPTAEFERLSKIASQDHEKCIEARAHLFKQGR